MVSQRASVALVCAAAVLAVGGLAAPASAGALSWGAPEEIDKGSVLNSVSCGSPELCVAVGRSGRAFITTDPGASSPKWSLPADVDTTAELLSVSCFSTVLCLAVDEHGEAVRTLDPTAEAPAWGKPWKAGEFVPTSVSCPSASLCVEVGGGGHVAISKDPTAEKPAWSTAKPEGGELIINSVSCPSTSLCVAVDGNGDALIADAPEALTPKWEIAEIDKGGDLLSVSCASMSLCVAVDHSGHALLSTDPAGEAPAWKASPEIDGKAPAAVACPSTSLCAAVDSEGDALSSSDPTAESPLWSSPVSIDGTNYLASISCPSMLLCITVGSAEAVIGTAPPAPVDQSPPSIAGTPVEGQELTEGHGAWSNNPTGYTYQWLDCDSAGAGCSPIAGASGPAYTLGAGDVGHTIRVTEAASNDGGVGAPATSEATTPVSALVVIPGPHPSPAGPTGAQLEAGLLHQITPHGRAAKTAALLRRHGYSLSFTALAGGVLVLDWYYLPRGAHLARSAPRPVLVASGTATFASARTQTIVIRLSAAGRRLLAHSRRLALTARASFTPSGRSSVTLSERFTLTR